MKKIIFWIKNHQVVAFYILTFSITWGLGFSYRAVLERDKILLLPLVFVAMCGPGLAGIIISAITNTQPRKSSSKAFWMAFFIAWFTALFVFLANWKYIEHNPLPLSPALVGIIAISAVPVAFVIASAYSRNPAVRNYLTSLVQLRGVWGWSLVALLLLPVLFLISVPVSSLVNNQLFPAAQFPELSLGLIGLILVKFLYQLFFFNATGEETGWRGFALPRIQEKTSPLIAAVITGFFWALWHFPMWQVDGRPVMAVGFWVEMFAGHILFSVPIVWMCNRSRGSILVAGIAHAAMNTVQAFAPFGNLLFPVISVAALVMILVDRMWVKLPSDHPAVSQAPISDSGDQPFALPVK